jgi:hypothetical protein
MFARHNKNSKVAQGCHEAKVFVRTKRYKESQLARDALCVADRST